jgi:hypothetical protein
VSVVRGTESKDTLNTALRLFLMGGGYGFAIVMNKKELDFVEFELFKKTGNINESPKELEPVLEPVISLRTEADIAKENIAEIIRKLKMVPNPLRDQDKPIEE